MLMLLRQTKPLIATIAIQITVSYPVLAIQAPDKPSYLIERVVSDETQYSHKATCKLSETCPDTSRASMLIASEKKEPSEFPDQSIQNNVAALLSALRSDKPQIRRNAAMALGRLGETAEHTMPALLVAAGDNRWDVRADAVWAIGRVTRQEHSADAVSTLTTALDDPSDRVRWSAAWSLARIGPAAEAAIPSLIKRLKDPARKIRASAVLALTKVASQSNHDVILQALAGLNDDHDHLVRARAAKALRSLKLISRASPKP